MKLSLRDFLSVETKSKIKAGDGQAKGDYKFFTSSPIQSKFINLWLYDAEALVFGTGGNASVHYVNDKFSTSTDCLVMTNKMPNDVNLKCIYYYLAGNIHLLAAGFKGCGLQHISKEFILNIKIDLPERDVQDEIVAVFDLLTTVRIGKEKQLQKLDNLVKSQFIEMFGELKTNSKGWEIYPFSHFAKIDGQMTTDYKKYANYPHIGIDSIEKETGELKGYRTVAEDGVISGKYLFSGKHIIYSKIRPNLNKVALPNFEGLCSADAYPILPNTDICNRYYLAYVMRSPLFLEYILQFSKRTNMPKVNRAAISGFTMPLPPNGLQNEFAQFVEQTDKSKVLCSFALEYQNRMACLIVKMPRICYN